MRTVRGYVIVIFVLTLYLIGCKGPTDAPALPKDVAAPEPYEASTVLLGDKIVVGCSMRGGFALEEALTRLLPQEAERLGMPIDFWFLDGKRSPEIQVSQAEYFISQEVDIIILSPASYTACDSAIMAAVNAKTPIITILSRVSAQEQATAYVGPENQRLAEEQCRALAEVLGGSGRIAILEYPGGCGEQLDINAGYSKVLEEYPGISVVARQTANARASEAYGIVDNWIYNDVAIDAILAQNDGMALGAAEALEEGIAWKSGKTESNIYGIDVINTVLSIHGGADSQAVERLNAIHISAIGGSGSLLATGISERITDGFVLDEEHYARELLKSITDVLNGEQKINYHIPAERTIRD